MSWPIVELGDISYLITKGTTPTTLGLEFAEIGVPFIRVQNLVDGAVSLDVDPLYISNDTHKKLKRSIIYPNDILVSIAGTIGRTAVVSSETAEMNCNQAVAIIRLKELINKKFFFHWMNSKDALGQIMNSKVTGTISNISLSQVGMLKIPLPPLQEQKRIAAILDQADALRRLRQRAIDRFNTLGQAIFYEMFDGEYTQKCNNSLGDFVEDFRYGTSNKSNEIGYPALRIPNVIDGKIEISDLKMVPVTNAELDRLRLQDGDLLFVRTNGNPDYVGRSAVFNPKIVADTGFDQNDWIYASYLIRGRLKKKKLHPVFLHKFLSTPQGRLSLRKKCRTSAGQFNINIDGLSSIPIILPEFDKQTIFVQRTNEMEKKIKLYEISKNRLDALFYSLQHRAFRGEL